MLHNKRLESARAPCPTRKSDALLLAAHSRRWTAKAERRMKMVSELHQSRQGANQHRVAGAGTPVLSFPGCHCAHHFASRAVPKAVQLNRLALRSAGQFRSPRSFVLHRAGVCSAILRDPSPHAARARSSSLHSAAKTNHARRQSNNALQATCYSHAPERKRSALK
jgi:hypothetical protein